MSYGDMEFGQKNRAIYEKNKEKVFGIRRDDVNRHIKLISIAKKGVDIFFQFTTKGNICKFLNGSIKAYPKTKFASLFQSVSFDTLMKITFTMIYFQTKETEKEDEDLCLAAPHFETNIGENDDYLLKFEKYVSDQEVAFFSQKMDYSKLCERFKEIKGQKKWLTLYCPVLLLLNNYMRSRE